MATLASHSKRSSSVKRLLQEAKELRNLKSEGIYAEPLEDSIHEFHFTIEGPKDSEFEGGIYHGRICVSCHTDFVLTCHVALLRTSSRRAWSGTGSSIYTMRLIDIYCVD